MVCTIYNHRGYFYATMYEFLADDTSRDIPLALINTRANHTEIQSSASGTPFDFDLYRAIQLWAS